MHTVRYAGVLAAASPWRPRIAPKAPAEDPAAETAEPGWTGPAGGYRPWAEFPTLTTLELPTLIDIASPPGMLANISDLGAGLWTEGLFAARRLRLADRRVSVRLSQLLNPRAKQF